MGSLVWFEARGEPILAQRGVLDVAINRSEAMKLPICEVILQPGQFQWTKRHDPTAVDDKKLALLHSVQTQPRKLAKPWRWFYTLPHPPKWAHNMTCRLIGHTTLCKERK